MLALLLASWAPGATQPQNSGAVAPRDAERAPLVEAALKRLAAKAAIRRIVASTLVATPSKTLDTQEVEDNTQKLLLDLEGIRNTPRPLIETRQANYYYEVIAMCK